MAFWDTAWSAITGAFDSTADGAKSNGWQPMRLIGWIKTKRQQIY